MSSAAMDRLALWTALSGLALLWTLATVLDTYRDFEVVRQAVREGRLVTFGPYWWVAVAELVASLLRVDAWTALSTVGLLGHEPELAEYRSWGQLIAVTFLAIDQGWRLLARGRTRRAVERRDGGVPA